MNRFIFLILISFTAASCSKQQQTAIPQAPVANQLAKNKGETLNTGYSFKVKYTRDKVQITIKIKNVLINDSKLDKKQMDALNGNPTLRLVSNDTKQTELLPVTKLTATGKDGEYTTTVSSDNPLFQSSGDVQQNILASLVLTFDAKALSIDGLKEMKYENNYLTIGGGNVTIYDNSTMTVKGGSVIFID